MILCVGLSPAWQRHMYFDDLKLDEVNRATGGELFSSGKVLNVVVTAHCLGAPCLGLTFCGGLQGEAMREDMKRRGIAFEGVETEEQTRCCTTLINRATGEVTELVESDRRCGGVQVRPDLLVEIRHRRSPPGFGAAWPVPAAGGCRVSTP